ncbi:hypothetical protein DFS34DRAFT_649354 [Phlyctochytrium arcticum]|nr:hypothetical protein DFS34DRAFT_649354 [Phlyctochytrium arcticum]
MRNDTISGLMCGAVGKILTTFRPRFRPADLAQLKPNFRLVRYDISVHFVGSFWSSTLRGSSISEDTMNSVQRKVLSRKAATFGYLPLLSKICTGCSVKLNRGIRKSALSTATIQATLHPSEGQGDLEDLQSVLRRPVSRPRKAFDSALPEEADKMAQLSSHSSSKTKNAGLPQLAHPADIEDGSLSISHYGKVIKLNSLAGDPDTARKAFDLIQKNGLQADDVAFNLLLDAYVNAGRYEEADSLLLQMSESGVERDVVTYGTMIKGAINKKELHTAFSLYQEMKKAGIVPSEAIFTNLIQGCLRTNDIKRAWATFDHLKSEICVPDLKTYTLMIHACSLTGEAERAMSLFREMREKGLSISTVTYTALFQALVSSTSYYTEAFGLLNNLVEEGLEPDERLYLVLLKGAAAHGDVTRARTVWNGLITFSNQNDHRGPSVEAFTSMLEALTMGISRAKRQPVPTQPRSNDLPNSAADADSATSECAKEVVAHVHTLSLPESTNSLLDLKQAADRLWQNFLQHLRHRPEGDSSNGDLVQIYKEAPIRAMVDQYFAALCAGATSQSTIAKATAFFETGYKQFQLTPMGRPCSLLLSAITKNKAAMANQGTKYWNDLVAWDQSMETEMNAEHGKLGQGRMLEREKEVCRIRQGRGSQAIRMESRLNGEFSIDRLSSALAIIESSQSFRGVNYLRPIQFKDIWKLVEKSRNSAEDGDLKIAQRLLELCPEPSRSVTDLVHRQLKTKSLGSDWWGWRLIGNGGHPERKRRSRKNSKAVTR